MVTISIAERSGALMGFLQKLLGKKGVRFCIGAEEQDGEYIFLPPKGRGRRDVVLLHQAAQFVPPADYITILNADEKQILYNKKSMLITYGFNPLATMTASSIRSEEGRTVFSCCLQRSIATLKGRVLEPQEFPVSLPEREENLSCAMGAVALGLVLSLLPGDFF